MKKLKVAIAGLGTVGKSVYEILSNDSKSLFEKHNVKFEIIAASARSKKSFLNDNVKENIDYRGRWIYCTSCY